ncbi:dihydrolipoamide succinyltransferase [Ignatzschineria ureiclastica]|uniref:Dihydrolipoyllysine-residue succinyltransferase component of 2-oxoglutarate dehydrogenase complex n=1 Tax=Ignatzschineria ureiclastica TaxID=472582 RepID=A0A2U2ACU2_9GAMM|nr:2-oxoglutarate dehydrogenase complex dihydrolipoyllysine-residue succinyltransferase [Ignatzschineria ureiclastica]PWD80379.1 dihydrolipoamide succinyltransferase [Ignatzschineria ureiclastica]GGZ99939.1 dihydrolipoyllysine-residue succinyltransferase component of 2-oxoglutarate dehydrogenase complex [Ignatzschineria ureiclastica]
MSIEIKVPTLPESVADALLSTWHKQVGDHVEEGENLVDLETDKVMLEVPATASGTIKEIKVTEGTDVTAGTVLAIIEAGSAPAAKAEEAPKAEAQAAAPAANEDDEVGMSPTVRRLVEENKLDITKIPATGKNGRHLKEDIENFLKNGGAKAAPAAKSASVAAMPVGERVEKRVPMTRLRARIAERLLDATNTTAMLTTFNEINMEPVISMRKKYQDRFTKVHGVKLGFMSFFVKAAVEALKKYPAVNASIDGNDIVYHGYFDIGIAVSSPRGLVVPIIRNADQLSLADIEKQIIEYATKAKEGTLTIDEMTGGTFTITNGGVFGSMLSTPIINPPQSGILGMHNTYERPIVKDGQIIAAPMMYVAHSYDHRIIDGAEAVGFLVSIKNALEDPASMILEL